MLAICDFVQFVSCTTRLTEPLGPGGTGHEPPERAMRRVSIPKEVVTSLLSLSLTLTRRNYVLLRHAASDSALPYRPWTLSLLRVRLPAR